MAPERAIDSLPSPSEILKKRVIVLSASRTGTFDLHNALELLGYKPSHFVKIAEKGIQSMRIWKEGIQAVHQPSLGIQPYGRAEFDKWFAEWDCLVEAPSYLTPAIIDAYIDDPDVKFIMTERSPASFAKSVMSTIGPLRQAIDDFPVNVLRHFDAWNYEFFELTKAIWARWASGLPPSDPKAVQELERNYAEYMAFVRRSVPEDRLLVLHLGGKGFGYGELCPFLGKEVPDHPYPRTNNAETFGGIKDDFIKPGMARAMVKVLTLVAVPVGLTAWYMRRR